MAVGQTIRWFRLRAGLTQAQLAARVRINRRKPDRSYITHVERGDIEPSLAFLRSCAHAFGVRPWNLIADMQDATGWWDRYLALSPVQKREVQNLVKYYYEGSGR